MAEPNLQEIHDLLIEVAKKAGQMITSARPTTGKLDTKKNSTDLVTSTDKAVEEMVSTTLKTKYPDYAFVGEETCTPGTSLTATPTFIVDPIDGTTNFVHAHPYISISLGLLVNLIPTIGIVYNPFSGHLYHSIRNQGSFLTTALPFGSPTPEITRRLPLRAVEAGELRLEKALVCVEWGNEREGNNWKVKTGTFAKLAGGGEAGGGMVHSLRSLGSAALNLCGVAAGEMDAYWEGGCWAWDVCAGWVVLEEAGGMVVGANRGEWEVPVDARRYLAVRGAGGVEEQRAFVESFWGCVEGRLEY
ncbi:MAG: hypothetical protein MMC23_000082 [Stictis urceolatum]|nr:hypothetical protein [Stictis urceolata]